LNFVDSHVKNKFRQVLPISQKPAILKSTIRQLPVYGISLYCQHKPNSVSQECPQHANLTIKILFRKINAPFYLFFYIFSSFYSFPASSFPDSLFQLCITHCSVGRAQSPSAPTEIYAFGMVALGDRDIPT